MIARLLAIAALSVTALILALVVLGPPNLAGPASTPASTQTTTRTVTTLPSTPKTTTVAPVADPCAGYATDACVPAGGGNCPPGTQARQGNACELVRCTNAAIAGHICPGTPTWGPAGPPRREG